MIKFGKCEGYTGEECENCGRVRVEHYSNGFDICDKCDWCKQLERCVFDDDFYEEEEYGGWWKKEDDE